MQVKKTLILENGQFARAMGFHLDYENVYTCNLKREVPDDELLEKVAMIITLPDSVWDMVKISRNIPEKYLNKTVVLYEKSRWLTLVGGRLFTKLLEADKGYKICVLEELISIINDIHIIPVEPEEVLAAVDKRSKALCVWGEKEEVLYELFKEKRKREKRYMLFARGDLTIDVLNEFIGDYELKAVSCHYDAMMDNCFKVFTISTCMKKKGRERIV